ncbi:hypothetical protein BDZ89DRAFT_1209921 [Hymenopellis radicata]|nr:hypothetical protein BDZ89DRAFT_1209921 [Hymenopellis radicata]
MRVAVEDLEWKQILSCLRYGRVNTRHRCSEGSLLGLLKVRRAWNDVAVQKHCQEMDPRLYVCGAIDAISSRDLTLAEEYGLALRSSQRTATGKRRKVKNDSEETVAFAIGARLKI